MRGTGIICTHVYMYILYVYAGASQVTVMVKNLPASEGDTRDPSWIPGSGRSSGEGQKNKKIKKNKTLPVEHDQWFLFLR